MSSPDHFSWIDPPRLAGCGQPQSRDELLWLRRNGTDLLLTLTEDPISRTWLNDVGLISLHVPVPDMDAPTQEQIVTCIRSIHKAHAGNLGVTVHCLAGRGRTGTILACYEVTRGRTALEAIRFIREVRPGSIETDVQEEAVSRFARDWQRHAAPDEN